MAGQGCTFRFVLSGKKEEVSTSAGVLPHQWVIWPCDRSCLYLELALLNFFFLVSGGRGGKKIVVDSAILGDALCCTS